MVAKAKRESLRTWSGCKDVMKVSLDMARNICQDHQFADIGQALRIPNHCLFRRSIRFHLMIYVPGVLWKADSHLDYIMTDGFNIETLYRDILKIFHLCANVTGVVSRHAVEDQESAELSQLLCGPVDILPKCLDGRMTLGNLLLAFRDLPEPRPKAFTSEQAMLLPTIQLSAIWESVDDGSTASIIQTYKGAHSDQMALSGAAYLNTLAKVFETQRIWEHFMMAKGPNENHVVKPRDNNSGAYGRPVVPRRQVLNGAGIWHDLFHG